MLRSVFYWLRRAATPPVFVITVNRGSAAVTRGRTPASWVDDCAEIGAEFAIRHGYVEGVRTNWGLGLRFSPGIPKVSHQRFRNVFAIHQTRR